MERKVDILLDEGIFWERFDEKEWERECGLG